MAGAVPHDLLPTPEAVRYLGGWVTAKLLHRHREALGAVKLGRLWLWPRRNLDALARGKLDVPPIPRPPKKRTRRKAVAS